MAYLMLILKYIIYGSSVYFTSSLSQSVDVLDILALRFLMSFAVFYILKSFRVINIDIGLKDFTGKSERSPYIKYIFLAGLFEPVLYMFFETIGITMTTGVTCGVILSLTPVSACITEQLILKERSTFWQKVFLIVGIAGVMHIAFNTNSVGGKDTPIGILFVFLAVISGSVYLAFSRKSSGHFNSMEITYFASIMGAAAFNFINVIRHIYAGDILSYFMPYFSIGNMIGFIFLAVISTIIATCMNNYAVSKIQLSTAAAFGGISTLVTILIGVLAGGEKIYAYHIVGFILILIRMVGVSYISIKNDNNKK